MAPGSAPRGDSPPLQCECRRASGFERGLMKWSFALLIVGAAALDAFWVVPAEHALQVRPHRVEAFHRKCPGHATTPPRRAPPAERELRVIDVKLLTPSQVDPTVTLR
jgi:hypothetical protein